MILLHFLAVFPDSVSCVFWHPSERVSRWRAVSPCWVHSLSSHNDIQSHTSFSTSTGLLPYLVKTLLEHLHNSRGHGYHHDFEKFLHHYRFCLEIGTLYKYNQLLPLFFMMIMQLLEVIPFQQLPCLPRVLIAKDSWQVNLLGRRLWQLTWPSGFAMMTNEIIEGPGASVPGNRQEDDSSSWACNKLFQATNHPGALFQNAVFNLILKS